MCAPSAMPTSGSRREALLDTSAAVALVVADHQDHDAAIEALAGRRLGLSGHAVFETFSVLTRLPPPARRTPATVAELIAANFPASRCFLSEKAAAALMKRLADLGIGGGSVFDALVAAAADEHGITLVSRDRQARETYRRLGVQVEMLL
jgi:predicted nucleic acid-binding protein